MDPQDRTTLKLEMHLFGEHDKIVQTLRDLSEAMQREVDLREPQAAEETTLREITDEATRAFEEAAGPGGSPEMFCLAYATLPDRPS